MPIKFERANQVGRIGATGGEVPAGDEVVISYDGDTTGEYEVTRMGERIGAGALMLEGSNTTLIYQVTIPPVDKNEPPTIVKRSVYLERI